MYDHVGMYWALPTRTPSWPGRARGGGRGTSFPGYRHPRTQGAALGEAPNLAPSALELFILIHRVSECKEHEKVFDSINS
jgi:hypothetical protein